MPTPETSIWQALKARVKSLSLTPALPVSYPNEQFKPGAGNYLTVKLFRNEIESHPGGVGGLNRHTGILQITLMFKKNEKIDVAYEIAGQIAEHFKYTSPRIPMTSDGVTVFVQRAPVVGSDTSENDAPRGELPITIRWEANIPRT